MTAKQFVGGTTGRVMPKPIGPGVYLPRLRLKSDIDFRRTMPGYPTMGRDIYRHGEQDWPALYLCFDYGVSYR